MCDVQAYIVLVNSDLLDFKTKCQVHVFVNNLYVYPIYSKRHSTRRCYKAKNVRRIENAVVDGCILQCLIYYSWTSHNTPLGPFY